jgi:hypothetical protein
MFSLLLLTSSSTLSIVVLSVLLILYIKRYAIRVYLFDILLNTFTYGGSGDGGESRLQDNNILLHDMKLMHNVLYRNLNRVYEINTETMTLKQQDDYLQFVDLIVSLIESHHHTEDVYLFPKLSKDCQFELAFRGDHEAVDRMCVQVKNLCQQMKHTSKYRKERFVLMKRKLDLLLEFIVAHFRAEEDLLSPRLLQQRYSQSHQLSISRLVFEKNIQTYNHTLFLIGIFIYSLKDSERKEAIQQVPWIIQTTLPWIWNQFYSQYVPYLYNHPNSYHEYQRVSTSA